MSTIRDFKREKVVLRIRPELWKGNGLVLLGCLRFWILAQNAESLDRRSHIVSRVEGLKAFLGLCSGILELSLDTTLLTVPSRSAPDGAACRKAIEIFQLPCRCRFFGFFCKTPAWKLLLGMKRQVVRNFARGF